MSYRLQLSTDKATDIALALLNGVPARIVRRHYRVSALTIAKIREKLAGQGCVVSLKHRITGAEQ